MADRVELHTVFGVLRQRAWVSGNEGGSTHQRIEVGQLADGRHYASHSKKGPAFVFPVERPACELADRWLSVGEWRPTPACFDGRAQPADGLEWHRAGGTWLPGKPPVEA